MSSGRPTRPRGMFLPQAASTASQSSPGFRRLSGMGVATRPGQTTVHADAVGSVVEGHVLGEDVHPALGRVVGRELRIAQNPGHRGDVDDRAPAPGWHHLHQDEARHEASGRRSRHALWPIHPEMTKPVRAAVWVDLNIEGLRADLAPDTA